jgi:glucose/arabinose dehydrogenase
LRRNCPTVNVGSPGCSRARDSIRRFPILGLALFSVVGTALGAAWPSVARAQVSVPSGFAVEDATPGSTFDTPTGIAFLPDGRFFVAEKRGRVYLVTGGVRAPSPHWNGEREVLNADDRGLLDLAVDPKYFLNHYVYLLYTVDPDSNGMDDNGPAFGRLVRYRVGFTDSSTFEPSSRTVLMGSTWSNGPLSGSPSHTIGSLRWGEDGTLLVSEGDGASFTDTDAGGLHPGLFTPGRGNPADDIGAFRAQWIGSMNGKLLRLDPATGLGLPSNPYWNGDGNAPQSKVWAYGFRNPFRFTVRPGTGAANPTAGDPGSLFIGDVGWNTVEEIDVASQGGRNFGWPCIEGPFDRAEYQSAQPAHCGCDSVGTAHNPAPRTTPTLAWHHTVPDLSVPPGYTGNCSISGAFYTGTTYPPGYQGRLFFADFGQNWMKTLVVNAADGWTSIQDFATGLDGPVDVAASPVTGDLYYVSIYDNQIRRIRYVGTGANQPPTAVASANPPSGVKPLTVSFSSLGTNDADADSLSYVWSFGDATGSSLPNPSHVYTSAGQFFAVLTVDDNRGGIGRDTITVTVVDSLVPFPSTMVLDNFNKPDGPLNTLWQGNTAGLQVLSMQMRQTSSDSWAVWNGPVFGVNQEAYVTLATTSVAPEHDLMLKVQGLNWNTGHIEVRYDATVGRVFISTYTPGVGWQPRGSPISATFSSGDRLGARAESTGVVQVFRNGSLLGSASVSAWPFSTSGGRIGFTLVGAINSRLDDYGGGDIVYSVPNTSPAVGITTPVDGSFYAAGDTVLLRGTASDAEQGAATLSWRWQVDLHHNTHVHPSVFVAMTPLASFVAQNHDDGTGVFYDVMLIVTDQGGLRDTARVDIHPEVDLWPTPVTLVPGYLSAGTATAFRFSLRNAGRMPAPRTRWRIVANATTLVEGDTSVAARDSVSIQGFVPPTIAPGRYTLRVVADTLGQAFETVESNNAQAREVTVVPAGATAADGPVPRRMWLSTPYPNPSRGALALALELPATSRVSMRILDIQGRELWAQPDRSYPAGRWTLRWEGRTTAGARVRPGVYLARVVVDGVVQTRRIAIVR